MKSLIFLFSFTLLSCQLSAQCKQEWIHYNLMGDSSIVNEEYSSPDSIKVFNLIFSYKFLDSVVDNANFYEKSNLEQNCFKLYKIRNIELVHYTTERIKIQDTIFEIHDFSYSEGLNGKWNEDACYHFLYLKNYGIIKKGLFLMGEEGQFFEKLKSDYCLSKDKLAIINKL